MRLHRFLSIVISITFVCLLYVYQQTEIFRLAYIGQKQQTVYQDLLDKNIILRYNIDSGASLSRIGARICESDDFRMPDSFRLMKLTSVKEKAVSEQLPKETILSRLFGIKRQAEAKTINP